MTSTWIPENLDLTNCDREPIHIPGSIQPHGVLFVINPDDLKIIQASENTEDHLSKPVKEILGQDIEVIAGRDYHDQFKHWLADGKEQFLITHIIVQKLGKDIPYTITTHKSPRNQMVVELEAALNNDGSQPFQYLLQGALSQIQASHSVITLCQKVAESVQTLTHFDRVMIYRFDENANGEVIAEARVPQVEPYLGLHYPASDIPKQARELYKLNPIRVISDVSYTPVSLVSIEESPSVIDMSFANLRSVSPIHIEYLKNMGVKASMSISILIDGELWGLIACHHYSPVLLSPDNRLACTIIGRILSMQLVERERSERQQKEIEANHVLNQLFESMTREDDEYIINGLILNKPNLLDLVDAYGVVIQYDGHFNSLGRTPGEEDVQRITTWLAKTQSEPIYATDHLALENSQFEDLKDLASGLLAVTISRVQQDYIIWFKPEVIKTVTWAGSPEKRVTEDSADEMRLHPRLSFAAWEQIVKYHSHPWMSWEVEIARRLRSMLIDTAMRVAGELKLRANILANLNTELERSNTELDSFAYVASHDLKEPLRGIHNYATFLLEDYSEVLPKDGIEKVSTLIRLSQRLETLIDALLEYSRVGRLNLSVQPTDLNSVVNETVSLLKPRLEERKVEVKVVDTLPTITCDPFRIMSVFTNLITNAIKYNDKEHRWIEIGLVPNTDPQYVTLYVRDNGIGIKEQYFDTIFKIFKRLHSRDSFGGGTGAGLTIAKKIVERHEGQIWVESVFTEGSIFYFTLKDLSHDTP